MSYESEGFRIGAHGRNLRENEALKDPISRPPNVGEGTLNQGCANSLIYRPNPRVLIEERIQYHNEQANDLHALLRALPQEMSREAEDQLAKILLESRPRY